MEEVFENAPFLQTVAEKLKPSLPASACMYNISSLHSRGLCDQFDIYTPRELPHTAIVLYKAKDLGQSHLGVYSGKQEADQVQQLLRKTNLVNWDKDFCFFHLPDHLVEVVEGAHASSVSGVSLDKSTAQIFTYSSPSLLDPIKCPRGVKVCRLGKKGIETMLASYRYKTCINSEKFSEFVVRVPNVGVYPDSLRTEPKDITVEGMVRAGDEDVPLAWASLVEWGSIGMMNTCEPGALKLEGCQQGDGGIRAEHFCRREELLGLAVEACARMVAREGLHPIVVVEDQDKKDIEMFKNLSGWSHSCKVTWMWKCQNPDMYTQK